MYFGDWLSRCQVNTPLNIGRIDYSPGETRAGATTQVLEYIEAELYKLSKQILQKKIIQQFPTEEAFTVGFIYPLGTK